MVSLSASVAWWARTQPDRTALVYGEQRVSYGELQDRVERAAGLLRRREVGSGQVVALLMKNSAAFVELALAVSHVGAVLLPVNYRLGTQEVAYILEHSGAVLLLCDEELQGAAGAFPHIVVHAAAQQDSRVLSAGGEPCRDPHVAAPDDLYRLMYTSGTTDMPKGVMHTYANVAWKNADHIAALGLTREDRLQPRRLRQTRPSAGPHARGPPAGGRAAVPRGGVRSAGRGRAGARRHAGGDA